MSSRISRTLLSLNLLALAVVSMASASAEEPSPSLYEKRLGIIKGTSRGIVLWDPEKAAAPTAATASAATPSGGTKAETTADGKPVATAPQAAQAPVASKFLSNLPPPSGRSMAEAQRFGAVGGGITLPTKATQTPPAEPAAKP